MNLVVWFGEMRGLGVGGLRSICIHVWNISELKKLMSLIQDAFYIKGKSIIYILPTFWSLENLEIIPFPVWRRVGSLMQLNIHYEMGKKNIKYLTISSSENVGIYLFLVDVGTKGGRGGGELSKSRIIHPYLKGPKISRVYHISFLLKKYFF